MSGLYINMSSLYTSLYIIMSSLNMKPVYQYAKPIYKAFIFIKYQPYIM